jgi:hypothetical protein
MSCLRPLLISLMLLVCFAPSGYADEFRPAYLQLTQIDTTTYDVLWKIPAIDENTTLKVKPVFPAGTETVGTMRSSFANNATVQRWRIKVAGGLTGKSITFTGLAMTRTDVLVRLIRADGTTQLGRVLPVHASIEISESPGTFEVVRTYAVLGIEHILTGFDHLLFVLALILITMRGTGYEMRDTRYGMQDAGYAIRDARSEIRDPGISSRNPQPVSRIPYRASRIPNLVPLLKTVTAFTVAHSVTLALAILGFLHVPGPPVEALIALSIVFVAAEIVRNQMATGIRDAGYEMRDTGYAMRDTGYEMREIGSESRISDLGSRIAHPASRISNPVSRDPDPSHIPSLTARAPWLVAFAFGLLHGLGFAGALAEVGLPPLSIPTALLFFNVGVEIGQLMFIAAVFGLVAFSRWAARSVPFPPLVWLWRVPPYLIGGIASYWVLERIASF